jgi:hypothetical protein
MAFMCYDGSFTYLKSQICFKSSLTNLVQYARLYNMHNVSEHCYKEWLCDICIENYLSEHPHSAEIDFYKI